jgi:hypothetical protein
MNSPLPQENTMDEIFRASEQDWKEITRRATSECVGILELRDRVAYLETSDRELTGKLQTMQTLSESQRGRLQELSGRLAALEARPQGVFVDPEATITFHRDGDDFMTTVAAPVRNETGQYLRAGTPVYTDHRNPLVSYSVGEARPLEECGKDHVVPASAAAPAAAEARAKPSDKELWAIRLQALAQEWPGGGWAPWRPRKSVNVWGAAQICANRALFDAGVEWATRRAEQQTTTEEPSAAQPAPADPDTPQSLHDVALVYVDSLGRSFGILPAILDTLRRAIREPLAAPAEPGKVATDEEIQAAYDEAYDDAGGYQAGTAAGLRAVYDLGRQHGAACPYIRSSDEGTSYCALAEQPAPAAPVPAPEPAPPPPIRVGQKWRRGDGVVAEIIKVDHPSVYSVKALHLNPTIRCAAVRSSSLYTSEGKYINDDLPRGIHPQDLAELIEDAPAPDPAPPAPAGGLVEQEANR